MRMIFRKALVIGLSVCLVWTSVAAEPASGSYRPQPAEPVELIDAVPPGETLAVGIWARSLRGFAQSYASAYGTPNAWFYRRARLMSDDEKAHWRALWISMLLEPIAIAVASYLWGKTAAWLTTGMPLEHQLLISGTGMALGLGIFAWKHVRLLEAEIIRKGDLPPASFFIFLKWAVPVFMKQGTVFLAYVPLALLWTAGVDWGVANLSFFPIYIHLFFDGYQGYKDLSQMSYRSQPPLNPSKPESGPDLTSIPEPPSAAETYFFRKTAPFRAAASWVYIAARPPAVLPAEPAYPKLVDDMSRALWKEGRRLRYSRPQVEQFAGRLVQAAATQPQPVHPRQLEDLILDWMKENPPPIFATAPENARAGGGMHDLGEPEVGLVEIIEMAREAKKRDDIRQVGRSVRIGWSAQLKNRLAKGQIADVIAQEEFRGLRDYARHLQSLLANRSSRDPRLRIKGQSYKLHIYRTSPNADPYRRTDTGRFLRGLGQTVHMQGRIITGWIELFVMDLPGVAHEVTRHVVSVLRGMPEGQNQPHTIAFFMEGLADGEVLPGVVEGKTYLVAAPHRALEALRNMTFEERGRFIQNYRPARSQIYQKFPTAEDGWQTYGLAMAHALHTYASNLQSEGSEPPRGPGLSGPKLFSPPPRQRLLRSQA